MVEPRNCGSDISHDTTAKSSEQCKEMPSKQEGNIRPSFLFGMLPVGAIHMRGGSSHVNAGYQDSSSIDAQVVLNCGRLTFKPIITTRFPKIFPKSPLNFFYSLAENHKALTQAMYWGTMHRLYTMQEACADYTQCRQHKTTHSAGGMRRLHTVQEACADCTRCRRHAQTTPNAGSMHRLHTMQAKVAQSNLTMKV